MKPPRSVWVVVNDYDGSVRGHVNPMTGFRQYVQPPRRKAKRKPATRRRKGAR